MFNAQNNSGVTIQNNTYSKINAMTQTQKQQIKSDQLSLTSKIYTGYIVIQLLGSTQIGYLTSTQIQSITSSQLNLTNSREPGFTSYRGEMDDKIEPKFKIDNFYPKYLSYYKLSENAQNMPSNNEGDMEGNMEGNMGNMDINNNPNTKT
jgi:hypothetical protein